MKTNKVRSQNDLDKGNYNSFQLGYQYTHTHENDRTEKTSTVDNLMIYRIKAQRSAQSGHSFK